MHKTISGFYLSFLPTMLLLGVWGFSQALAKQRSYSETQEGCSIKDKSKPPQSISFERLDRMGSQGKGNARAKVWLRLHNNTGCSIMVQTESARLIKLSDGRLTTDLQNGTEVNIEYELEDRQRSKAPRPATPTGDEVILSRLPPATSILFSVPSIHFRRGLSIVVPFRYEWEPQSSPRSGPVLHRIYFEADDWLRESVR